MATVNMSDSKQHTDSRSEVLLLTDEALKLARTACHFDKNKNYIGACDYYDRCLLNIDEVLNKLQPNSEQWKDLLRIRSQYDDRMEQLREYESIRLNINSSMISVKPDSKSLSTTSRKKRHKFDDETKFSDIQELSQLLSDPPVDAYEVPYWQLKNVRNTILTGGFLTKTIFIPKKVWYQSDVKFSGLTAKSTAFSIINNVISLNIDTLYLSCDEASLDFALSSLLSTEEEFFQLQNQLSKPFPYIKEIHSNHRNSSSGGVSTSNSVNNMAELQDSQSNSPANLPATAGGKSMSNRSLTGFVSNLSKNVRKFAEVGYQRLVVALPSKLSTEELQEYASLIVQVCEKCQVLESWYKYMKKIREQSTQTVDNPIMRETSLEGSSREPFGASADSAESVDLIKSHEDLQLSHDVDRGKVGESIKKNIPMSSSALLKVDAALLSLRTIAGYIRDIVCEILLRDIEWLVERYLSGMRKSFSRMYWDEDGETD